MKIITFEYDDCDTCEKFETDACHYCIFNDHYSNQYEKTTREVF